MPYKTNDELPDTIKDALPAEAQSIFRNAFNSAYDKNDGNEEKSNQVAWGAVKNAGWVKKENGWVKENTQTYDIDDLEIFAVGKWNGVDITDKDLDSIVSNFSTLSDEIKPPLKLGHRDNLNERQKDGFPALGWVKSVRKVGGKLLASFKKMPEIVYRAIKAGGYRTFSSEVFRNYISNGKEYGKVLCGVALVGADLPAVTNLKDLENYFSFNGQKTDIIEYSNKEEIMPFEDEKKKYEDSIKVKDDKIAALENENAKLKESNAKDQFTRKVESFKVLCENSVKEGKLLPAVRDKLFNIIEKKEFSIDAPEILFTVEDVQEIIENSKETLPKGEKGKGSGNKDEKNYTNAGEEITRLTAETMDKEKIDYDKALQKVLSDNPELADEYIRNTEGE